jgi:hypothetical protein
MKTVVKYLILKFNLLFLQHCAVFLFIYPAEFNIKYLRVS